MENFRKLYFGQLFLKRDHCASVKFPLKAEAYTRARRGAQCETRGPIGWPPLKFNFRRTAREAGPLDSAIGDERRGAVGVPLSIWAKRLASFSS